MDAVIKPKQRSRRGNMNRAFSISLIIAFIVMGCSSNPPATNILGTLTSTSPTIEHTIKPSYTETVTQTPLPTATNTPEITPTFDPATIFTRTPSTEAQCPSIADIQNPKFPQPDYSVITFRDNVRKALDFLNQGGNPEILINAMRSAGWLGRGENNAQVRDLCIWVQ